MMSNPIILPKKGKTIWKNVGKLILEGDLAVEWESFTNLLESCYILLEEDDEDILVWSKNTATWDFTEKHGYDMMAKESFNGDKEW